MKYKIISVVLFLFFIIASVRVSYAQKSYNLKYKFEKGKSLVYKNEMHINMVQQVMGNEVTISSDMFHNVKFETANLLADGNAELLTYLDSGYVHSKYPGIDTTIYLNDYAGKKIKLTASPKGEIILREIIDTVPQNNLYSTGRELVALLQLPAKKVTKGSTWDETKTDTVGVMGGNMVRRDTTWYKVTSIEKMLGYNCLVIEFKSNSTFEGKGNMSGMDLVIEGTGTTSGKNYFAPAEGIFVHLESTNESQLSMTATGQQSLIIPINQKLTTNVSLLEIK